MDALVAYLQILGRMVDFTDVTPEQIAAVGGQAAMAETLRLDPSLWLLWLVLLFIAIVAWAFWPKRKRSASSAHGEIPLNDDDRGR